uniref:MACPF domain-containing protein n=1 Tax=Eutreptiella gymnastica TaxID=73025 RepID=A0A7S1IYP5_9EUGL
MDAGQRASRLKWLLQGQGIPAASVFLYSSPMDIVNSSLRPEEKILQLLDLPHKVGGTSNRQSPLGALRVPDVQRVLNRLRDLLGSNPDRTTLARFQRLEKILPSALGLGTHRTVYLEPRLPFDIVLPTAHVHKLAVLAHAPLSGTNAAQAAPKKAAQGTGSDEGTYDAQGNPIKPEEGTKEEEEADDEEDVGEEEAEPGDAKEAAKGAAQGAACQKFRIVQNGVNAAALAAGSIDPMTLEGLRTALNKASPADGMFFLDKDKFPVQSETDTDPAEIAANCTITMSSQKAAAGADADAQAAAQAEGAAQAAAAQELGAQAQASGQEMLAKLGPAVTAAPLINAKVDMGNAFGSGGETQQVYDLSVDNWKQLFAQNNLFRAYTISASGPVPSERQIWEFVPGPVNYAVQDGAKVKGTQCNSTASASAVASGYTSVSASASVGVPGAASAGVAVGSKNGHQQSSDKADSKAKTVKEWLYPRAQIWPLTSLKISKQFTDALSEILDSETMSRTQQATALQSLFIKYGDHYPKTVTLGGKAFSIEDSASASSAMGKSTTSETTVSASGSYSGVSASAGYGSGSSNSNNSSNGSGTGASNLQTTGGNSLLTGNWAAWVDSLGDAKTWRTITYGEMVPISNFIPLDMQSKLNELMNTPEFQTVWADPETVAANRAYTLTFANKYITLTDIKSTNLLGTLALSGTGDMALFRPKPTDIVAQKAVIWHATPRGDSLLLKTEAAGGLAALYLTEDARQGSLKLMSQQYGPRLNYQLWDLRQLPSGDTAIYNKGSGRSLTGGDITFNILASNQAKPPRHVVINEDFSKKDGADLTLPGTAGKTLLAKLKTDWEGMDALTSQAIADHWLKSPSELYLQATLWNGEPILTHTPVSAASNSWIANVGPGSDGVGKTISIPDSVSVKCPAVINKNNWLGGYTYGDTYKSEQVTGENGKQLKVSRTDVPGAGWGMNLQFSCDPALQEGVSPLTDITQKVKSALTAFEGKINTAAKADPTLSIKELVYIFPWPQASEMGDGAPSSGHEAKTTTSSGAYGPTTFAVDDVDEATGVSKKQMPFKETIGTCKCCAQGFLTVNVGSSGKDTKTVKLPDLKEGQHYGQLFVQDDPLYTGEEMLYVDHVPGEKTAEVRRIDAKKGWSGKPTLYICTSNSTTTSTAPPAAAPAAK